MIIFYRLLKKYGFGPYFIIFAFIARFFFFRYAKNQDNKLRRNNASNI